jgi:hypothetical protein
LAGDGTAGMEMMNESGKHSTRVAIVSALVSLVLSIVFAAYIVGQRTGKVLEIDRWKTDTAPRIEKMDLEGSVATKNFVKIYDADQAKQYKRIEKLEEEVSHLDKLELRVERLEGKVGKDGN